MRIIRPSCAFQPTLPGPARESLAVAQALGLDGRLGAWRGRSGSRYIVSTVPLDRLPEFGSAVFIAVALNGTEHPRVAAIVAGEAVDAADDPRFRTADAIDVHLLAGSEAARERVVADLSGTTADDLHTLLAPAHDVGIA